MSGAIRHTVATQTRVRELYAAEWSPSEIQRVLEREGHTVPSEMTIWVWTHPDKAAATAQREVLAARRRRAAKASYAWPGVRGPEWKLGRMKAMRKEGLSTYDIARMMRLDFPNDPPLTADQVRHALKCEDPPRALTAA